MNQEEMDQLEQDRQEAMEQEYRKTSGGNYFNYVDVGRLEREGVTHWKPSLGDNSIRVVFPPDRPGYFGTEIFKHSNIGVNRKTFICRRRMFDEPCPICEFADQLRKIDPSDARIRELNASRRYLFFVVDISSKEEERKGKRWFDCPVGLFNEIKSRSKNKRRRGDDEEASDFQKYINVAHPTRGRDIEFEQVKEKGKYSYVGCQLIDGPAIPESWYSDLPVFVDILKESSEEEMLEAVGDQLSKEPDSSEQEDGGSREAESKGETRGTREETSAEAEPEVDTEDNDGSTKTSGQAETREGAETREVRGTREDIASPAPGETGEGAGEDDMKARVKARLEKARKQREQK